MLTCGGRLIRRLSPLEVYCKAICITVHTSRVWIHNAYCGSIHTPLQYARETLQWPVKSISLLNEPSAGWWLPGHGQEGLNVERPVQQELLDELARQVESRPALRGRVRIAGQCCGCVSLLFEKLHVSPLCSGKRHSAHTKRNTRSMVNHHTADNNSDTVYSDSGQS